MNEVPCVFSCFTADCSSNLGYTSLRTRCRAELSESDFRLYQLSPNPPTWVGGGYLNATAEAVFKHGLLHTYAPFGYTISLLLGSLLFAGRMRLTDAVTMLDPFQKHYGRWMGLLLALPVVGSEVLWSGAILSSLERQPATPPGDDVSKARTPKQSSPKGSPSPKHPYSLRAGATPTGLGGASPTRDAAAARAAKTPPELSTKGSPASTPAARASGTASPNFPSSTTRPKGAPRAVTTTATKSPLKGVSTSQLLHRTVSHESTSLRR
ncbi:uncharacterized protein [Dermacentor albipictus]|uniref:uncharacterized protein isoform X2 n=1 Tax=Dermacentor albipictus TaxID=60249 RepID=UPI0031FC79CF